ncbi:CNNM domain-containing protein [Moritella dasanensis]|uniref:CNNM domain-containing protein n=1 Tax=Moritella dasanensis TaxID=428031 RepID=UPI0003007F32|nr:CNNM domain-containing protein [Moritella dasanensis]
MILLFTFVFIAVGVSFLCSIAEAVLLSVPTSFIVNAEQEGELYGSVLRELKNDINNPLAVILTLNTVAHTMGAAGAGAQIVAVFGNMSLGIFSAVLTFIILVFSEILPKALGAHYWRRLAPVTAYTLRFLIRVLYPFVLLSNRLTRGLTNGSSLQGFSRQEFKAMVELGEQEGELDKLESMVLKNLFCLRETLVQNVMTPRTVVFAIQEDKPILDVIGKHNRKVFSRIPLFSDPETITGFVLRNDLFVAQNEGYSDAPIKNYRRELSAVLDVASLFQVFETFISEGAHIMLVVNEYGDMQGIVTLEDILESLLGVEIVDELDTVENMKVLARRLGTLRRKKMGLDQDSKL